MLDQTQCVNLQTEMFTAAAAKKKTMEQLVKHWLWLMMFVAAHSVLSTSCFNWSEV
jgi:hypothetical protein